MIDRFVTLPMCFVEEDELYVSELRLLPFSIEGYVETTVSYVDDDSLPHETRCVKIFLKSGNEFDIMMGVGEFEKIICG